MKNTLTRTPAAAAAAAAGFCSDRFVFDYFDRSHIFYVTLPRGCG